MKIGCCIDISYYDKLVRQGFDSITLAAKDVAAWDQRILEKYCRKLAEGPLERISLNNFCTGDLRLNGKYFEPEKVGKYAELIVSRAAQMGFQYIGIGAPGSRNLQPGDKWQMAYLQFKQTMGILCEVAGEHGVEILMESVCSRECNFITTVKEALTLVRELDYPNLHLVYDIYHEHMERQPVEIISEAIKEIRVVHIAQDADGQRAYLNERHFPEYLRYWKALEQNGYKGEWSLEAFTGDPDIELKKSMQLIRKMQSLCDCELSTQKR